MVDEDDFRTVAADDYAQGFLIEVLLSHYLNHAGPENAAAIAKALIETGVRTEHFGRFESDAERRAEQFADIAVRAQERIAALVQSALERAGAAPAGEGGSEDRRR